MYKIDIRPLFLSPFIKFANGLVMMGMLVILSACQSNELTQQERLIQNAADAKTAATLFDYDLDNQASYNVHRDGSVIIKFDKSVQTNDYTAIVDTLRTIPEIHSVYATQGGRQVCPLQSIQK